MCNSTIDTLDTLNSPLRQITADCSFTGPLALISACLSEVILLQKNVRYLALANISGICKCDVKPKTQSLYLRFNKMFQSFLPSSSDPAYPQFYSK